MENNKKYCVYMFTNLVNNKKYIGYTKDFYTRVNKHKNNALSKDKDISDECPKFYNSIRKHGFEKFKVEILEEFETKEEAIEAEMKYIRQYNTIKNGLNILEGCKHYSGYVPIGRKDISGKNNPMYGKIGALNPFYGKAHSIEAITKIASKSKFNTPIEHVKQIKEMINNLTDSKTIRNKFDISHKVLSDIRHGKRWAWLDPQITIKTGRTNMEDNKTIKLIKLWNKSTKTAAKFVESIKHQFNISYNGFMHIIKRGKFKHLVTKSSKYKNFK